jgi:hypothetical protein
MPFDELASQAKNEKKGRFNCEQTGSGWVGHAAQRLAL